ncbi:hypothetical protein COV11_04950 [Candidatus Woesearchaeota archaeon CG10_big_fil_rev_8_21_14_0_10_30_7]|nr:MAG: hypothetical protein COV11_04950 [Candidatus Woesearchaeota archaeon CG10_big_fil_rev_8_21_14_0_10_30_7]
MNHQIYDNCLHKFNNGGSDVLLFLRGLGTRTKNYESLINLLANNFEVIVPTTSKMKNYSGQPKSIDEYIERLQELCTTHNIEPKYVFGHSLGGHITLKEPFNTKKNIAVSPIVPVNYGLTKFLLMAGYQGAKMSINSPDKIKGLEVASSILKKVTFYLPEIVKFVHSLCEYDYNFKPKSPSLVIEALNDEFFPASEESKKLFQHKNIIYKTVPRNHAWPIFYPEEVYEEIKSFF